MPFNIGCPSCASIDCVKFRADGEWYDRLTLCNSLYHIGELTPCICLNCGNIYIDRETLSRIKEKVNKYEEKKI